jgi:hypothetical protein
LYIQRAKKNQFKQLNQKTTKPFNMSCPKLIFVLKLFTFPNSFFRTKNSLPKQAHLSTYTDRIRARKHTVNLKQFISQHGCDTIHSEADHLKISSLGKAKKSS